MPTERVDMVTEVEETEDGNEVEITVPDVNSNNFRIVETHGDGTVTVEYDRKCMRERIEDLEKRVSELESDKS